MGAGAAVTAKTFDFSEATALVFGGASGIGLAMAEGLLAHGARVAIVSRSAEKAGTTAEALAARVGGRAIGLAADATDEHSIEQLRDEVAAQYGGQLNIAINSAGINIRNPIERISLPEWESVQRVNITG